MHLQGVKGLKEDYGIGGFKGLRGLGFRLRPPWKGGFTRDVLVDAVSIAAKPPEVRAKRAPPTQSVCGSGFRV